MTFQCAVKSSVLEEVNFVFVVTSKSSGSSSHWSELDCKWGILLFVFFAGSLKIIPVCVFRKSLITLVTFHELHKIQLRLSTNWLILTAVMANIESQYQTLVGWLSAPQLRSAAAVIGGLSVQAKHRPAAVALTARRKSRRKQPLTDLPSSWESSNTAP